MKEYADRLVEQKNRAWESAKDILTRALDENRDLTAEEQEQYDRANADIDNANAKITEINDLAARAKVADEARANLPAGLFDEAPKPAEKTVEQSFMEAVRAVKRGSNAVYTVEYGPSETRALADFSDYAKIGGAQYLATIQEYQRTFNPTYRLASVIASTSGNSLIVPVLTADVTTYTPGEGTAITESSPTLGSATAVPVSYKALSYISAEFEEDAAQNILNLLARSHGRQLGLVAGSAFTLDATNGWTVRSTNGGTASATPFFGATDLITLFGAVAVPYQANGAWQMSTTALAKARKFVDTTGQFIWLASMSASAPDMILGRPVYENPHMAAVASATKSVAFGDFSAVWVKEVQPVRVEISRDFKFDTDQVAIKTVYRAGSTVADTAAIAYLVSANS